MIAATVADRFEHRPHRSGEAAEQPAAETRETP
jgi:hypothetical protein